MKRMIFATLLLALSCAPKSARVVVPTQHNPNGVMRLIGRFTTGHACPCSGLILTAAHVAHPLYLKPGYQAETIFYAWSDDLGHSGYLGSASLHLSRDLGELKVLTGQPAFYRHAEIEPKIGDTLYWVEYDYKDKKKAYAPIRREAHLVRNIAGHLILNNSPVRGASGSCLFNGDNEVVGVIVWSVRVGVSDYVGIAVSVAGQWWPGK